MVNLKVKPYYLNDEQIRWVEDTIGMSLNYTNHLIDVPQLHTFINAYGPTRTHISVPPLRSAPERAHSWAVR